MRIIILTILIFFGNEIFAQKIIRCTDSIHNPIGYVSIYDTVKHEIVGYTNSEGYATINSPTQALTFSHISFKEKFFLLNASLRDDTSVVVLNHKQTLLEEYIAKNFTIDKKNFFQFGNFNKKASHGFIFREKVFVGFKLYLNELIDKQIYLRSIKFVLQDIKNINKPGVVLELKIFKLLANGAIDSTPVNTRPIYLPANKLSKKNEIKILENIEIPSGGIFLSFELPSILDDNYDWTILFKGNFDSQKPVTYIMRNRNGYWNQDILQFGDGFKYKNLGYFQPQLNITYWKGSK